VRDRLRHMAGLGVAVSLLAAGGLAFVLGSGASAQAATTATTATQAASTLAFSSTSPVLVQTSDTTWRTNVVVTVSSNCAPTLSFWLVLPSGATVPTRSISESPPSCPASDWQVLPETLTFGSLPGSPATATLVVSQNDRTTVTGTAGGVATTQLTLQRLLPSVDGLPFGWVIVAAGAFALVFLMLALASEAGRNDGRRVVFSAPVYASASWTFKDSWATNITAVGAVLGGFFTASSSVATMFPGVPLYRFTIANLTCGAIVVVVPLVVAVCIASTQKETQRGSKASPPKGEAVVGSIGAVLVGGTITMFAVGAELSLFGILIDASAATGEWTVVFLILLAIAALVVLVYALLTTYKLNDSSADAAKSLRNGDSSALAQVTSALARSADTSLTL
jgi:hypothetical protein